MMKKYYVVCSVKHLNFMMEGQYYDDEPFADNLMHIDTYKYCESEEEAEAYIGELLDDGREREPWKSYDEFTILPMYQRVN